MLTGMVTDPLGRKRSLILGNIPFIFGWLIMYRATTVWEVFIGILLNCLCIGLIEAPLVTYLGEIW